VRRWQGPRGETIHAVSSARGRPFVKVNCAAFPWDCSSPSCSPRARRLHRAHRRKAGQFEQAQGGTIYLDEVAELPLSLQAKLLHVVQDLRFTRVGTADPSTSTRA